MNDMLHGLLPRRTAAWIVPLLMLWTSVASGQVVPPPDTLPVDPVVSDTMPVVREYHRFPLMSLGAAAGFAAGEWVWDRDALLREAPTSLVDLLRRIPAVATFRAGMFAQPEAAAAFGGTAGRVELEIDGYVLDPLVAATFDLATLPMAQIRELRVQRRLGLLRIRILTDFPEHALPYTRIEAGVGQPPANLFRGVLLAPHLALGPLGLAVERLDTDGLNRSEPASLFSGWGKWSWTDGRRGVQLELLSTTLQREPASPWPVERSRQDVVLRARNSFTPNLLAEVYAGRSSIDETVPVPVQTDTIPFDGRTHIASIQAGGRVTFDMTQTRVAAAFRYREAAFLPRTELSLEADAGLGPVRVGGELIHAGWDGAGATHYGLHTEVGRFFGASAFGELTGGTRGARGLWHGAPAVVLTERTGWRAGISMQLGTRATGSIARIGMSQDAAYPFGLPFDTAGAALAAGDARGVEASGRLVIVPGWLAIESWITDWSQAAGWTYLPVRTWRTALELHAVPLESANLEILGRFEGSQRSASLGFLPSRPDTELAPFTSIPAHTVFNGYLQIRIIDVRIFLRWEDFGAQDIEDLPGRFHRGPRVFYGVKWNLWN
jgi:hypothetical protein